MATRKRSFGNILGGRARRRSAGSGVPKIPKPPKAPKLVLPKTKELGAIYKKLISGSYQVRIAAIHEALDWWDAAIIMYLRAKPLDTASVKNYETANKARALGLGSGGTEQERELSLITCLNRYEKVWGSAFGIPSVKGYLEKLEAARTVLEAKENKLQSKYESVLEILNKAFGPLGIKFQVQQSEVPREFDGDKTILLSSALAKVLSEKAKREGYLPVVFSEANTVIKACAMERDSEGSHILNLNRLADSLPNVFAYIMQFCGAVERNKVFKLAPESVEASVDFVAVSEPKAPKEKKPRAEKAPGTKGPRSTGPKVAGRYTPGSAMAILYERLSDQRPQPLSELFTGVPATNPQERLKWLVKHGNKSGQWKVVIAGNTVQMTIA